MPSIGETQEAMSRPGSGWLECIGLSVRRDEFPELFEKLGSKHGALTGAHFNLPSTPYTYIYAGGAADKIGPTVPSVPGETADMIPVDVPPSPIMSVAMEPTPGLRRQVGPDDPSPSTRVQGAPPGGVQDTMRQLAATRTVAAALGTERTEQIQEAASKGTEETLKEQEEAADKGGTPSITSSSSVPEGDLAAAQRNAAQSRVASGPAPAPGQKK